MYLKEKRYQIFKQFFLLIVIEKQRRNGEAELTMNHRNFKYREDKNMQIRKKNTNITQFH